jgi:formylglycine-generating enzyme required for sulfatase activity
MLALLLNGWALLVAASCPAQENAEINLGAWYTTGPLETKSFGETLFPEKGIDLAARAPGGESLWEKHADWSDGRVHDLPGSSRVATYLFRTLTVAKRVSVWAHLGSDDGLAVWLNGRSIWAHDVPRGAAPNQDRVRLNLRAGENRLLMKIYNHGGGHGFYFALDEEDASLGRFMATPSAVPLSPAALRLAIEDLMRSHPTAYPRGQQFLGALERWATEWEALETSKERGEAVSDAQFRAKAEQFRALQREALLANPVLDFDRLLLVRRKANQLGLPQNWQGNCALARQGYDNEIAVLSPVRGEGKLNTLYKPLRGEFVGDVDLHFHADRMLFSSIGTHGRWQIFEIRADSTGLRQVTPGHEPDVDNYDPCYLPDGRILFCSTRCFQGVPCVGGGNTVANLCLMDADGSRTRQVCFDQDHDWCPTVLPSGRVLYSRWEYSDSPHYFTRLLFQMNPDGTGQAEYYGSNSMWPNSIFYARPLPGHTTKIVAVISGHHGVPRMGELVVFDPAKGRHEADGAVQRIPGRGRRVEPMIRDGLVEGSWPKSLHPYPLSEKYFLVSCQPSPESLWGIYLVDVFDNMVLLREEASSALLEPIPFCKSPTPPVVPDRVDLSRRDALVYLSDVYEGRGLKGVPPGSVKKLRAYQPHYAYPGMGGHIHIGIDGPWDARRILGTVPVEEDGSASFRVPANTPIAVQPLDARGRALQVMRSWFTAMPGETLSCTGCHESQNTTPPAKATLASRRTPSNIAPWHGPERGFSFKREVQPVLDKYCAGCHDGRRDTNGNPLVDLSRNARAGWGNFTPSYVALHPFVRRPGPESDYHLQMPLEFHAGTSELVQMLEKGHCNVKLDAEAWDRLVTWIDLNVPDHGTWTEQTGSRSPSVQRRLEMRTQYANRPEDPEAFDAAPKPAVAFVRPEPAVPQRPHEKIPGWPFDAAEAQKRQAACKGPAAIRVDLTPGLGLDLVLIPAGEFIMGDCRGEADEGPETRVRISRPFYLGRFEITNAQYALFDPRHDSGVISETSKDHNERGIPVNSPNQPVVRIAWKDAMAFCAWLSAKTGRRFILPTEAQWEWACRAGTATPMNYGDLDTDFGPSANLADATLAGFARGDSPQWHPKDSRFRDGALVTAKVGSYRPNAWGLCDVHGNAAEWTRSSYRPYPYDPADGREEPNLREPKTVRGGSWYDRPKRARSAFRLPYATWQGVYNVGFRVAMESD